VVEQDTRWESALSELPRTRRHLFLRRYGDEVNRQLLERWLPARGTRVLKTDLFEEAIGDGMASLLGKRFERVDAIDVSPAVVEEAARRHPGIDTARCDVRALPYEGGTFDAVVSTSTLDHFDTVSDIGDALRELRRVLAPGGTLIVSLDNLANPLVALRNALPFEWLHRIGLVPHFVGATCRPR
jgi:ubiquinone/menaquinone biosynthesis C-methylase UbiE